MKIIFGENKIDTSQVFILPTFYIVEILKWEKIVNNRKKRRLTEKKRVEKNLNRTEKQIWKYRERKKKERRNNNARMGRVLFETAGRAKGKRKDRNGNEEEETALKETQITVKEVERQRRNLKKRRATGRDGV
jgi:hypothetical protein